MSLPTPRGFLALLFAALFVALTPVASLAQTDTLPTIEDKTEGTDAFGCLSGVNPNFK